MSTARLWQAVALSEKVSGHPVALLEKTLRRYSQDCLIWFPALTEDGNIDETSPFASYIFVNHPAPPALQRSWCVARILPDPIPEAEVERSVGRKVPLRIGDEVTVVTGELRGLSGKVTKSRNGVVEIAIPLESGTRKLTVPRDEVDRA